MQHYSNELFPPDDRGAVGCFLRQTFEFQWSRSKVHAYKIKNEMVSKLFLVSFGLLYVSTSQRVSMHFWKVRNIFFVKSGYMERLIKFVFPAFFIIFPFFQICPILFFHCVHSSCAHSFMPPPSLVSFFSCTLLLYQNGLPSFSSVIVSRLHVVVPFSHFSFNPWVSPSFDLSFSLFLFSFLFFGLRRLHI